MVTLATRSAVLSVELRLDKEPRRFFAAAIRVVVCVRRSRMVSSRAASCSVVHASAAFYKWVRSEQMFGKRKDWIIPVKRGIRFACLRLSTDVNCR